MQKNRTPFQQKLLEPIQIPSLAKNIHVLMKALADDKLNFQQLADVIKHYPDITARIIFLANSPWSAPISPITSIEQACSRLGKSIVKSISIAISIASSFDTSKCPIFSTLDFWTSSLLVAEGSGLLASRHDTSSAELVQTAQTAGVLHNLGLLWLAENLPKETGTALQSVADDPSLSVNDTLKQYTGTDYCEVGGWIGNQFQFPEVLLVALEQHRNNDYQKSSWEIAQLVGTAAKMASALHKQTDEISTNSHLERLGLDSSGQTLIFQQLSKNFEKTRELARTLFAV